MPLTALIDAGVLSADEPLVLRRQSRPVTKAVLQADGTIRVDDKIFKTPSRAAQSVLGDRPVDGWQRWRVARLDNRTLREIRDNL